MPTDRFDDRQSQRPHSGSLETPLERRLSRIADPLTRAYVGFFYAPGVRTRITAEAARLLRQMNARRNAGAAEFQHQVEDLTQHAWRALLAQRRELANAEAFLEAFMKTMANYWRGRRRRGDGKAGLDDSLDIDAYPADGRVVHFPSPEKSAIDRQALELLDAKIKSDAPDLGTLFLAFANGMTAAREQSEALNIPIRKIYEMRRRLRRLSHFLNTER